MHNSAANRGAWRAGAAAASALGLAIILSTAQPAWAATTFNTHTPTLTYPGNLDGQVAADWQVSDHSDFSTVTQDSGTQTTQLSSYKTSYLPDGIYYARVRYQDKNGNWSGFSQPAMFLLDTTPPATPALQQPANDDPSPILRGSAFSDALSAQASARWQVSTHSDFSRTTVDTGVDTNNLTMYAVTPALDPGTYFARVRYADTAGNLSGWSDPVTFIINEPSPTPSSSPSDTPTPIAGIVSPAPSATNTPAPQQSSAPKAIPLLHPDQPASLANPPAAVATAVKQSAPPTGAAVAGIAAATGAVSALSGIVAQTGNTAEALKLLIAGLLPRRRRAWGTAKEKDTGLPIMGATVILSDREGNQVDSAPTDRFGQFTLLAPQADTYKVHAEASGHHNSSPIKLEIENPDKPPKNFSVSLANATDRPDPKAAAALARLMRVHGILSFLRIPALIIGTAMAVYSAYLYHNTNSYIVLAVYGLLCLREILVLLLAARTYGVVADERNGSPLFHAMVTFYKVDEDKASITPVRALSTDQNGRYRLRLQAGSYRLHTEHQGYLFRQADINGIRPSEPVSVNIRLVPEATFEDYSK